MKVHTGNLPHWRQEGVTYFVTSRLADSMPQDKLRRWRQDRETWLRNRGIAAVEQLNSLPEADRHEFHATFTRQWHQWLDAGYGECVLREPALRRLFVERLTDGNGKNYHLDAWVVMPNHFHALVTPDKMPLGEVVRRWKGGSSREINLALGRTGTLWQHEPYDHIVRSEEQWRHYRHYIADSPLKAKLRDGEFAVGVGKVAWASAWVLWEKFNSNED